MESRRAFLSRAATAVAVIAGAGVVLPGRAQASARTWYYASWTYYKKDLRTGRVTRLDSGSSGPYKTRREAQSDVDWYNSQDYTSGNYRYYYSARVTP
jgi:hypothetical protein